MVNFIKALIGILIVGIIIVIGIGIYSNIAQDILNKPSNDVYELVSQATADDIVNQNNGEYVYYFYQENCSHCTAIKPDVTRFYNKQKDVEELNFMIVDMHQQEDLWMGTEDAEMKLGKISEENDISISGTPTLIRVSDGEIVNISSGESEIPIYLKELENEYDL